MSVETEGKINITVDGVHVVSVDRALRQSLIAVRALLDAKVPCCKCLESIEMKFNHCKSLY